MKFTIVTAVLLGLCLTPALGVGVKTGQDQIPGQQVFPGHHQFPEHDNSKFYPQGNKIFTITVGNQVLTINREWRVAVIQQNNIQGSWKTIWNYNTGVIASKVPSERVCYISVMDRREMPAFDSLLRLAEQNRLQSAKGPSTQEIVYVLETPTHDLQTYGQEIFTMCRGLTTYLTYEVHGPQYTFNQGSCTRLDVLNILDLLYCRANIKA